MTTTPREDARRVATFAPSLLQTAEHHFCPGCGEPVAFRLLLEVLVELGLVERTIGVVGHGCYGSFVTMADVDVLQCLHGRAPACATGIKRMRPEAAVFTMQGDGDMINEGLQEILHAAARGESITCLLLNNGVFGDTGGHMTAATAIGQRSRDTPDGREASRDGYPIPVADMVASLRGSSYVARGAVHNGHSITTTRRFIKRALEQQMSGGGLTLVEIVTMCPTGWLIGAAEGPTYQEQALMPEYPLGELKVP